MPTPEDIIAEVALVTGVPVAAITGRRRTARIVRARFLAVAAIQQACSWWTAESIAEYFHSTYGAIIHARARHWQLLKAEPAYLALAREVCHHLFYGPQAR